MSETLPARRLPSVLLLSLVPVAAWFVVRPLVDPVPPLPALYASFGFSVLAFIATIYLVPALGPTFVKANLKGRDLLKAHSTPMYA
jgi:UDP-N-acetylglucosamine--dolichyl-phosphate N-acetylglucosaminephosphotransferase